MTTKTDGGPAFPLPCEDHRYFKSMSESGYGGMTLRDYFAAKAMQSIIYGHTDRLFIGPDLPNDNQRLAIVAYAVADAMIDERKKT